MVHGVCRRILNDAHDVDDAFQAIFLILVRKGHSIGRKDSVGSWLYRVAYHVALPAKARSDRRRLHHLVERKVPVNEMARQLGRHRSTIYREIKRNTFHDRELPEYSGYFSTVADDIAKDRRRRLRSR